MRGVSDSVLRMSSIKSALLQGGLSAKDRAWVKILVGFSSIVHLMWCSNPYRFFFDRSSCGIRIHDGGVDSNSVSFSFKDF